MRRKRKILLAVAIVLIVAIIALAIMGMGPQNRQQPAPAQPPTQQNPPAQGTEPGTGNTKPGTGTPPAAGCGQLRVYVLNVSQADSIFIITPGNKTILIDAGSKMKKNSSSNVLAFLKRMGVGRIDYVIATHYHEDHIGGMADVLNRYDVGKVYDNGNCGNYSSATATTFRSFAASKDFTSPRGDTDLPSDGCLSEARLMVAYERPQGCWTDDENENSLVLRLAYGNTSFIFTGDCEDQCEARLLAKGETLKSGFLKVGHHASATSSTPQFLDAVGMEYAVISADRARSVVDGYYHPRETTLEKLYARVPSGTYRTDLEGDIVAVSDGSGITVAPASRAGSCDIFRGYTASSQGSYSIIPALAGSCP